MHNYLNIEMQPT